MKPDQITECTDEKHAIKNKNGSVAIIEDTRCGASECMEMGCSFPSCAIFGDTFSSENDARKEYPNLILV